MSIAQDHSWNTGDGWFFDATNWDPLGVPQNDIVRIGDLPAAAGCTVLMGGQPGLFYEELHLTNGVTLDMNGSEVVSFGDAWITGNGTRLIARPAPFLNQSDFQGILHLGQGAHLDLRDNVSVILFPGSSSAGTISGRGRLITNAFNNNGVINPGNNGGLTLDAGQNVQNLSVDLDGSLGTGHLLLNTPFSVLQVNAGNLTDSFGGTISMVPGALLAMNVNEGWVADSNSTINVAGFNNPASASQISGTAMTFGGQLNIGAAEGHLRVVAPMTFQNSAEVNIGATDWLELDGTTLVQGGQYILGQGGKIDFDGPTTMQGGVFSTFDDNINNGLVAFNGTTTWNGNVTLNGASRQNGNATVSGGLGSVINANTFDIDGGLGTTTWNINTGLVVNADRIAVSNANRSQATFNIAGGFLSKLSVNLSNPNAGWVMAGTMNLAANSNLFQSRVAGSRMTIEGDLNVTSGRVRIDSDTIFSDSGIAGPAQIQIGPADAVLQMQGQTFVESNVAFSGDGTFAIGQLSSTRFEDGVVLGSVGLENAGIFNIDKQAGVASVNRFENLASGIWNVDIGGAIAGVDHDLLIVGGGEAFLGGFLEVDLFDFGGSDFSPSIGDEFTILVSLGVVNGTFLNDPVSSFKGQQYSWSVIYNSNDVRLRLISTTVPEPSTSGALLIAGLFWIGRRKRN